MGLENVTRKLPHACLGGPCGFKNTDLRTRRERNEKILLKKCIVDLEFLEHFIEARSVTRIEEVDV